MIKFLYKRFPWKKKQRFAKNIKKGYSDWDAKDDPSRWSLPPKFIEFLLNSEKFRKLKKNFT